MSLKKQVSLHGSRAYLTKDDILVGRSAVATGGEEKPTVIMPGSSDYVAVWEDFLGDLVPDEWAHVEGDTGASGAILANNTNGVYRIKLSATGAMTPAGAASLNMGTLNWKANQGKGGKAGHLRMAARVKIPNVQAHGTGTGVGSVFVGFTDNASAEMPIYDTGNTTGGGGPISPAADAVGFIWGPRGDTGWVGVSAKSTAGDSGDQSVVLSGTNPTDNRWQTLEVEVIRGISDTGGFARFYVDGVLKGRINSPIATATRLTPNISIMGLTADGDTADANKIDIDWVNVSALRDTGT